MKEFQANIQGKKIDFSVKRKDAHRVVIKKNGRESTFEIKRISPHHYTVLISNKCYAIHLQKIGSGYQAVVNGENLRFGLKDETVLRRESASSSLITRGGRVSAPMPGKVVQVSVKVGQKVRCGEGLVVVEAMKMQNVFGSFIDGIVKSVHVKQGDAVENGAALVDVE